MKTSERIEMLKAAMGRVQDMHDEGAPRKIGVNTYCAVRNEIRERLAELGEDLD
jgi:hypothetical protein